MPQVSLSSIAVIEPAQVGLYTMWATVAMTFITFLGLVATVWAFIWNVRGTRFAMGVELILKLEAQFESDHMLRMRSKAAKSLLEGSTDGLDYLLDYFQTIGMLEQYGAINTMMAWQTFFSYIHFYYSASKQYICETRSEDKTIWEDLFNMYNRMLALEKKMRKCTESDLILTRETIDSFLQDEVSLCESSHSTVM